MFTVLGIPVKVDDRIKDFQFILVNPDGSGVGLLHSGEIVKFNSKGEIEHDKPRSDGRHGA